MKEMIRYCLIVSLCSIASARLGSAWIDIHQPIEHRSQDELSQSVFEELRILHERGPTATIQLPQIIQRVHRIVVEGSAEEGEAFDEKARKRALKALHEGANRMYHNQNQSLNGHVEERRLSSNVDKAGKVAMAALIALLVVAAVGNIVGASTGKEWPFVGADNSFVTGSLGESFKAITPCDKLPLQSDASFGYLPITNGMISNTIGWVDDEIGVVNWFRKILLDPRDLAPKKNPPPDSLNCFKVGDECKFSAECCKEENFQVTCNEEFNVCKKTSITNVPEGWVVEPFCLLWSETDDGGFIDTLAFTPLVPWPPIYVKTGPTQQNILPKDRKNCEFAIGFPITEFTIYDKRFMLLFQFSGVAFSWADKAKIAFGTNQATSNIQIWDGFRNQPLPPTPDFNFWVSFRLLIVPQEVWQLNKIYCRADIDYFSKANVEKFIKTTLTLALEMDFEIYVAFDKQTDQNIASDQLTNDLLGTQEARKTRNLFLEGNQMWRDLQSTSSREDPCVIITMTKMRLSVPLIGSIGFGSAVGGFCNFSPEETGVRCTPSGFFFNIDQRFTLEGNVLGVLGSILETENFSPFQGASGNSIGIFQNPEGKNEGVVFRLEFPVASLFGVPINGVRPIIHFQVVKGSEVQRRRETILRIRRRNTQSDTWGPWVANCINVGNKCKKWAPFFKNNQDAASPNPLEQTEICSDILLNEDSDPDKLLYYNRVITAETLDENQKYLITPPDGASYKVASKYNYENNPDGNIVILFLAMADIGNILIRINEISVSLIISEGTPPADIPDDDKNSANSLYNNISNELKEENGGIWRPPSAYNFPSLSAYEAYLPKASESIEQLESLGAIERADNFNALTDNNQSNRLGVFIRLFCKISLLFFFQISIGLIAENFGDGIDPNNWAIAGQFQIDIIGLRYSVAVSTKLNFNLRRHRHLDGEEYERALAASSLEKTDWDVGMSLRCVPDSFCEAFVQFFKDVGEAIWKGMQAIGTFFADDVVGFIDDAINAIGEWGEKFVGALTDFANDVAKDIQNVFLNGEVSQLLDSGVEAFNQNAKKAVATLTDGKVSLEDIVAVGQLVLQSVSLVVDFIIAGVTDVINAIGSFFENVGEGIANWLGLGKPWDELRTASNYAPLSCLEECRSILKSSPNDKDQIKRNCWCTDELECHVKVPEFRRCRVKTYFLWTETKCNSWRYVETKRGNHYPRFDGRMFERECRQKRMAQLAKAQDSHQEAVKTSSLIDKNFGSNFNGLSNFSPKARLRRSLREGVDTATTVGEINIAEFQATSAGRPGSASVTGVYDGARLQPDSTDVNYFSSDITVNFDFTEYNNPGARKSQDSNGESFLRATQQAAAVPYLGSLKTDDQVFLSKQPIIEAPKLILDGIAGGIDKPIIMQCTEGNLALAWLDKLESFEPEVLRRNRARRLSSQPIQETLVDFVVENLLKEKIINNDGITLRVDLGEVVGGGGDNDIFREAKELLGTEGVGSFMDPNNIVARRRLQALSLSDYKLELSVMRAQPFCDHFEWTFEVTVADATGKSNPVSIEVQLFYGASEIETSPPSLIQTRCDSTPYGVEELEDNKALLNFTGVTTFKPSLKVDKCSSPFIHLSSDNMDTIINDGDPCTTNYKRVKRNWSLLTHNNSCPVPKIENPFFTQVIILGGFTPENGKPATPVFQLRNRNYYLPNKPNAQVSTRVEDFFANNIAPVSECGLCSDLTKAIVYSHNEAFICAEEGESVISVKVLNQIGIELKKEATARVFDNFSPNIFTKDHTVYLNQFGWLDKEDRVMVSDINDGTWDNCGIKTMSVNPTPIYQCNDEGPQTVVLTAIDTSINNGGQGNRNSKDQIVTVDDSERLSIDDNEYLKLPKDTKKLTKKHLIDNFNYDDCKEIGVYARPEGESNFTPLDYSTLKCFEGFVGKDDWDIPEFNVCDKESVLFHSSICKTNDENMFLGCEGQIKAEVLCRDNATKKGKGNVMRKQTCYRAKVITGSKKGKGANNSKLCKGKQGGKGKLCKGKGSSLRDITPRGSRFRKNDGDRAHVNFEDFDSEDVDDYEDFDDMEESEDYKESDEKESLLYLLDEEIKLGKMHDLDKEIAKEDTEVDKEMMSLRSQNLNEVTSSEIVGAFGSIGAFGSNKEGAADDIDYISLDESYSIDYDEGAIDFIDYTDPDESYSIDKINQEMMSRGNAYDYMDDLDKEIAKDDMDGMMPRSSIEQDEPLQYDSAGYIIGSNPLISKEEEDDMDDLHKVDKEIAEEDEGVMITGFEDGLDLLLKVDNDDIDNYEKKLNTLEKNKKDTMIEDFRDDLDLLLEVDDDKTDDYYLADAN